MEFYKETEFKDTEIGKMPKDWNVVKLREICKKIKAGGTPLTSKKEYWNGDIPFVKIEDITTAGKYLTTTATFISKEGLNNSNAWLVPPKSLLIAMYGSLGEVSINKIQVATNQAILGIIPEMNEDVEYLYYWFLYFKPNWRKYAKLTTQANLTKEIVENTYLPYPPLQERQKIAEILSTVDEAIRKTDEVIAKTERLKKGLMQELLTKGIGHKEFKDSEIGRIPKDWEVVRLGAICKFKRGFSYRSDQITNSPTQIRFITINDIEKEGGLKRNAEKTFIKEGTYVDPEFFVTNGDVLIANTDMSKGFIIGAPILIKGINEKCIYSMDLTKLIFDKSKIDSGFLFYYLTHKPMRQKMKVAAQGTNVLHLNHAIISNFYIPIPPLQEQQKIAEILSAVDKKLELERNERERLERIKRGLMDLLLTGKVRVRV